MIVGFLSGCCEDSEQPVHVVARFAWIKGELAATFALVWYRVRGKIE